MMIFAFRDEIASVSRSRSAIVARRTKLSRGAQIGDGPAPSGPVRSLQLFFQADSSPAPQRAHLDWSGI